MAVRTEGNAVQDLVLLAQRQQLAPRFAVPDLDRLVGAAARKPPVVWVKGQPVDLSNVALQRLQQVTPDKAAIARLLAAASRNLADAQLQALSADNRFDAAYKCLLQCAMVGLLANGYRTSTSQPGHHQTALQALPKSMGIEPERLVLLDTLRRKRNLSDYDGEPVSEAMLAARTTPCACRLEPA